MTVRVVLGALAALALIAGCQSQAPPAASPQLSLEPAAASAARVEEQGCARLLDDTDVASIEGRHRAMVTTVDAVRSGWCDPIEPEARVCRALFLIGATDPLVGVGLALTRPMLDELIERHAWALEEGVAAAVALDNAALAAALRDLAAFELGEALLTGPDEVAAVAVLRAAPSTIEPIVEAETRCRMG